MGTYRLGKNQKETKATLSGMDMPMSDIIQESETHITIKVPGHSVWVGYSLGAGKNTTYIPAEFQVFEKLPDGAPNSPHHNVREVVSFPVRQSKA